MVQFSPEVQKAVDEFRDRVFTDPIGVLDPEDLHHEFVSGNHGRKLAFDKIEEGTDMFIHWMSVYARAVREMYPTRRPDVVVGIANGANRVARHVGSLIGVQALETVKLNAKTVVLNDEALAYLDDNEVRFALITEDVGTTGNTSMTAANHLRELGVRRIEVVNGWQRNPSLSVFEENRLPYQAVVNHPLPMFSAEACASDPAGYCAQGVDLIEHAK
jgi:hypoxanthine phosphoribosyltransferase